MTQPIAEIGEDRIRRAVDGTGDLSLPGPVWMAWRQDGRRITGAWHEADSLARAVAASRGALAGRTADTLEICLTQNWQKVPKEQIGQAFANSARGLTGIEIRFGDALTRIAPTTSIASNRAPLREIERLAVLNRLTPAAFLEKAEISRFDAAQFLVVGDRCLRLWRGGQVVPPDAVGPEMLRETIAGLSGWMHANLHSDGRMTYKYWPSRGV